MPSAPGGYRSGGACVMSHSAALWNPPKHFQTGKTGNAPGGPRALRARSSAWQTVTRHQPRAWFTLANPLTPSEPLTMEAFSFGQERTREGRRGRSGGHNPVTAGKTTQRHALSAAPSPCRSATQHHSATLATYRETTPTWSESCLIGPVSTQKDRIGLRPGHEVVANRVWCSLCQSSRITAYYSPQCRDHREHDAFVRVAEIPYLACWGQPCVSSQRVMVVMCVT